MRSFLCELGDRCRHVAKTKHTHNQLFFPRHYSYVFLDDRRKKVTNTREPLDQLKNPYLPELNVFAINESNRFFLQWFNVFWNRFTHHKAQKQVIWTMSWWPEQIVITFLGAGLWLSSLRKGKIKFSSLLIGYKPLTPSYLLWSFSALVYAQVLQLLVVCSFVCCSYLTASESVARRGKKNTNK